MLETKIVKLASAGYRGLVNLSLRSLNRKERLAIKANKLTHAAATRLHEVAIDLILRSSEQRSQADRKLDARIRAITAAINEVENVKDDTVGQ